MCLCCPVYTWAQEPTTGGGIEMSAGGDDYYAKLRLETSIIEKQYCTDGRLHLTLRLGYINVGGEPVILDKRSSVIPYYRVSRGPKATKGARPEIEGRLLILIDESHMNLERDLDESHFVILKPGETYGLNGELTLPLYDSRRGKDSIRPGNHVLEVGVLTWYYPKASNVEWRRRWRQKGYLRSDSVLSSPMPFSVDRQSPVSDCRQ
jgi:hypothetical protein